MILSIPNVPASELLQPQGCRNSRNTSLSPKCKQGKVRLKSQHRTSLGDSWPLLTHQHMAASAVPGQCLGHFLRLCAPRELPLNSLYPNIPMREWLCLTTFWFLGASTVWVLTSTEFSPDLLACLHLPSCGDFMQGKVQHLVIVKRKRRDSARVSSSVQEHESLTTHVLSVSPLPMHTFSP